MAAAIALAGTTTVTITGTGFSTATAYRLQITEPAGGSTFRDVLSDGSGGFTTKYVPQATGTLSVTARPVTEWTGTTAAAASGSVTIANHPKSV
jgi:hypothetical protein